MKSYQHIKENERELIFLYLNQGKSLREIGKQLHRDHRTISREIERNHKEGGYSAITAQELAQERRATAKVGVRKLDHPGLQHFVIKKLGKGWSPETIAGRLGYRKSQVTLTPETIYQFIYRKEQRSLRLYELLRRQHRKRHLMKGRKTNTAGMIPNRVFIDQRPEIIKGRKQLGHWETDLMEGPRKTQAHVSVLVERKTRLVQLLKVSSKQGREKRQGIVRKLWPLPEDSVRSITFDNGKENCEHQLVARTLKCQTYFCQPYHSWEKGTVENTIGLVRQYLPKKMNLESVTQGELDWIASQLNNRPRKVLGYQTPSEVFYQETNWGI